MEEFSKKLAKTKYCDGYWLVWYTEAFGGMKEFHNIPGTNLNKDNDIQVVLEADDGTRLDDAVCHYGSYGCADGLWEIMFSDYSKPKNEGDDVRGHMTWKEVEKFFDKSIEAHKKDRNTK